jgi:hypothetical protein
MSPSKSTVSICLVARRASGLPLSCMLKALVTRSQLPVRPSDLQVPSNYIQFLRIVDTDKKKKNFIYLFQRPASIHFHEKVNRQNTRKTITYN